MIKKRRNHFDYVVIFILSEQHGRESNFIEIQCIVDEINEHEARPMEHFHDVSDRILHPSDSISYRNNQQNLEISLL